ncbi:MAG: hypothetical protein RH942_18550 [Kiloniellaceae bacterium]
MFGKRIAVAVLTAAMIAFGPAGVQATPQKDRDQSEDRDGQSRNESQSLSHVPLVLSSEDTMRVATIVMMTQVLTYLTFANLGVDVVSQNRVGLDGLGVISGLFNKTYDSDDFTPANDVGTVFRAGDDKLVIALKGDLKLEDYKVIIFNTDNEYQVRGRPTIDQIPPDNLATLGGIAIVNRLLLHTIAPQGMAFLGNFNVDPTADARTAQDVGVDVATEMPSLQDAVVGRAYLGPNNTILVVVRPASVVGDAR